MYISSYTSVFALPVALWAVSLSACGGAAVPQSQLTDAKAATSAAEAVGARDEPKAALHLRLAEDGIALAEKHIADGDNKEALPVLERARADAELAQMMANAATTRASAEAAITKLEALETEMRTTTGGQS